MKICISRPALGILPLCFLAATVLPFFSLSAQMNTSAGCMGPRGRGPGCEASVPTRIDPAEQAAFDAFNKEAVVDTKIALGEQFDQKYPHGRYQESVDTQLAFMYFNKADTAKFYAATDRVLETNPKNLPVLELAGWVIARDYNASEPAAAAKLDEAEKYEKRALSLIAAMKKPRQVAQPDFENSQASLAWRAHSGLGTVYFRRKDFADSAAELQIAVRQEGSEPDPTDLYVLGTDLENLNRLSDAADDFAQCSVATGDMQQQCQQAYEQASHAAVESAEKKAYDAFNNAPSGEVQIQLGEKFDQTYPQSEYEESVDSTLVTLYQGKQDLPKFYATADKVLAKDPDNAPILALVGWVIPRHYNPSDLNASARLDQAEKYEKHALDLVAAMQKPSSLTEQQFDDAKSGIAATAHSGLGATYFRRGDFADSAKELQLATQATADAFDYYMLGIDLHELDRNGESAAAFTKCGALAGYLQMQCNRDAEKTSQDAAQLTSATAKSAPPLSVPAAARDIPPSTGQSSSGAIRAETVVVPVRVVVRDNKGRAVTTLKKDNFKLYQDGKLQEIVNFTAMISSGSAASASTGGSSSAAARPASGSSESVPSKGATATASRFIALFFDDVHLYFADMAQIRTAAEKYLSSLQPQDRIAIVTASGQDQTDFTSDRDKLHATIAKLMPHPFPGGSMAPAPLAKCPPAMTYTEANAIVEQASNEVLAVAGGDFAKCDGIVAEDPAAAAEMAESDAHAAAEQVQVAGEEAINAVYEALQTSIRRLAVMRGQRAVVLVSPGFVYGSHAAKFEEITNLAIRDNVVINSLDAKGVYSGDGKWDPDRFRLEGFGHDMEYAVLQDLAEGTGGLFIHFNNDFAGSLREMSEPPEAYYVLGYLPQNLQPDGKFHVLKVSLTADAHGNLQARRGFFAPSKLETPEEAAKREMQDAVFSDDEERDLPVTLESHVLRDKSGADKIAVKARFDPSRLHFEKIDTKNNEELTVSATLFDENGNYVTGMQKSAQMGLDDAMLAQLEKTGFYVEVDLDVRPGHYVLRTVARDSNDGHISAQDANISIPN